MSRALTALIWLAVVLLTIWAFAIRAQRVAGLDGTLHEDEARLVLAAQGVLETGVPRMPSDRLYLRGVLSAYATAASIRLAGRSDFGVRLPNVVFGALLVPVLFLFGRALGGTAAGLGAALFAVAQPDLIKWSTSAWMTSMFVVTSVGALALLHGGFERDRPRLQVAGAAAGLLAVLAHELGALVVAAVALTVLWRTAAGDRRWFRGRATVAALAVLGAGLIVFAALGLALRAGTVAGSTGEFAHYFGPSFGPERFLVDLRRWQAGPLPLVAAALAGMPILLLARRAGGRLLYAAIFAAAATVWVIIAKTSERYGLILLPLVALAAGWALAELARIGGRRLRLGPRAEGRLRAALVAVVFGVAVYPDVLGAFTPAWPKDRTWPAEFAALGPHAGDLVFSDNPEIPAWYHGRADFWARGENYERYAFVAGSRVRHVYTGALRVTSEADLVRFTRGTPSGRLWYVGDLKGLENLEPGFAERLFRAARVVERTEADEVILGIDLGPDGLVDAAGGGSRLSDLPGEPPFGWVDEPAPGTTVEGTIRLRGWALDDLGVAEVRVTIDGRAWTSLRLNEERPDVKQAHPAHSRGSDRHGWRVEVAWPDWAAAGSRTLAFEAVDLVGRTAVIGTVPIVVR